MVVEQLATTSGADDCAGRRRHGRMPSWFVFVLAGSHLLVATAGSCPKGQTSVPHPTNSSLPDSCEPCAGGKYADEVGDPCTDCPKGTYQDQVGQTAASACTDCRSGQYSDNTGDASCKGAACAKGKFGLAKQTFADPGACSDCAAGRYGPTMGAEACAECGSGKYQDQVAQLTLASCKDCDSGQYQSQAGQASCSKTGCDPGSFVSSAPGSTVQAATCTKCPIGRYVCPADNRGVYLELGGPPACSSGRSPASLHLETSCLSCGEYALPVDSALVSQPGATVKIGADGCQTVDCPAGTVPNASRPSCRALLPGVTWMATSNNAVAQACCESCPAGFFQGSTTRDITSHYWARGGYAPVSPTAPWYLGLACQPMRCPPMWHASATATGLTLESARCQACPSGRFTVDYNNALNCTINSCQPGTVFASFDNSTNTSKCEDCAPGRYQPLAGPTSTQCLSCPSGRYAQRAKSSSCDEVICPPGKHNPPNAGASTAVCVDCAAGKTADQASSGGQPQIVPGQCFSNKCPSGKFWSGTTTSPLDTCQNCPSGRFQPLEGQLSCGSDRDCASTTTNFGVLGMKLDLPGAGVSSAPGSSVPVQCDVPGLLATGSLTCSDTCTTQFAAMMNKAVDSETLCKALMPLNASSLGNCQYDAVTGDCHAPANAPGTSRWVLSDDASCQGAQASASNGLCSSSPAGCDVNVVDADSLFVDPSYCVPGLPLLEYQPQFMPEFGLYKWSMPYPEGPLGPTITSCGGNGRTINVSVAVGTVSPATTPQQVRSEVTLGELT